MNKYEIFVDALLEYIHELKSRQYLGNYNVTEELSDLKEAIKRADLTRRQREVMNLYYFNDKNQQETARILGIRQRVVSFHLTASKQKIAKIYREWEELENAKL